MSQSPWAWEAPASRAPPGPLVGVAPSSTGPGGMGTQPQAFRGEAGRREELLSGEPRWPPSPHSGGRKRRLWGRPQRDASWLCDLGRST